MELTWWGTAAFRLTAGDRALLIDPYLSRNVAARPVQPLGPADVTDGDPILLTHGHFDHAYDVPAIAARTGATVYCSPAAGEALVRQGLDPAQVQAVSTDGQAFDLGGYQAQSSAGMCASTGRCWCERWPASTCASCATCRCCATTRPARC